MYADNSVTLRAIQTRMLNNVLWALVVIGGISTTVSVVNQVRAEDFGPIFVYVGSYLLIVTMLAFRSLGYHVRALSCLSVIYALGVSEFYFFGVTPLSYACMYTLIIFSGLLYGITMGLASFALVLTSIFGQNWYSRYLNSIETGTPIDLAGNFLDWVSPLIAFSFLAVMSLIALTMVLRLLDRSLRDTNQLVSDLHGEVSERQKAEGALIESETTYRNIFNSMTDSLGVIGTDGTVKDINPAFCEMYGYTREELLKIDPRQIIRPDYRHVFGDFMRQVKDTGRFFGESIDLRKDGSEIHVEVHGSRVMWGGETCLLAIVRNVTEQRAAEIARKELESQLFQSQRLESVGTLAGGVAHDFNNLLQAILGYGDMALENEAEGAPVHEEIAQILKASENARALVNQLLAFSRRQVLEIKGLNLNEVVAEFLKIIQRVIGEQITLDFVPGYDLGIVNADKGQIEQILMNLCVNARDAMSDGGTLTIETVQRELDDAFCATHAWAQPGRYAVLSVTDTGSGIDDETQQRIFEPFFTTKEAGKGTGLGLSTVFGIVRQHNGMVEVSSEMGVGTTFWIFIPITEEASMSETHKEVSFNRGGSETILVADDDELVLSVAEAILKKSGYKVLKALNGEEAIRIFDEHPDDIDLALLDVVMPKLSGKAVADHMGEERPETPVLFSSGYSGDSIHTNFVLDDGVHLIQKPYHREELLRKVREVIESEA